MATPEIKSVGKAFALLDCIASGEGGVSLPSMAKRCDLTMATAHRLLTTMEALGVVVHTGPGEYAIGTRLLGLCREASFESLLASAAAPILSRLSRTTRTTSHIGVLDSEFMVTYLARCASAHAKIPTLPGNKLEAYCSGLGKVLLAGLSMPRRESYLAEGPFPALTSRTIIAQEDLARELSAVCRRGFAFDDCEMFEDLRCVAVPIHDQSGRVVAALSASGSCREMPKSRVSSLAEELTRQAETISGKLFPRTAINFRTSRTKQRSAHDKPTHQDDRSGSPAP